jgi:hypothetical protein
MGILGFGNPPKKELLSLRNKHKRLNESMFKLSQEVEQDGNTPDRINSIRINNLKIQTEMDEILKKIQALLKKHPELQRQ